MTVLGKRESMTGKPRRYEVPDSWHLGYPTSSPKNDGAEIINCAMCGREIKAEDSVQSWYIEDGNTACLICETCSDIESGDYDPGNRITCHDTMQDDESQFKCSECGLSLSPITDRGGYVMWLGVGEYLAKPNYCPNCGSKVLSND